MKYIHNKRLTVNPMKVITMHVVVVVGDSENFFASLD